MTSTTTLPGLDVPADLLAVALDATALAASKGQRPDEPRLYAAGQVTMYVRLTATAVPFIWRPPQLRRAFGIEPSPVGGDPWVLPARLAETLGWMDYSGINDTDMARDYPGPHGHWWSLTWQGLAALAASEAHRDLALHIHAEISAQCHVWSRKETRPGGYPYATYTAQILCRLDEVAHAGV